MATNELSSQEMKTDVPDVVNDAVSDARALAPAIGMWWLLALESVLVSLTMCGCGHLLWFSLIITVPAVLYGMSVYRRRGSGTVSRVFSTAAFTIIVFLLVKNVADVLYLGHESLLR